MFKGSEDEKESSRLLKKAQLVQRWGFIKVA